MEWEPFPEELEPICYWTRKQVLSLFESCFQKGSNSLTRDVADIKALIEAGEIAKGNITHTISTTTPTNGKAKRSGNGTYLFFQKERTTSFTVG